MASASLAMSAAGQGTSNDLQQGSTLSRRLQHTMTAVLADLVTLVKHPVYVLNVAATAVYTGAQPTKRSRTMCCFCKLGWSAIAHLLSIACYFTSHHGLLGQTDRHLEMQPVKLETSPSWDEQRAISFFTHCTEGVTVLLCHCLDQAHQLMWLSQHRSGANPALLLLLFAVDSCNAQLQQTVVCATRSHTPMMTHRMTVEVTVNQIDTAVGVLGAYAYWGPKAGAKVFQLAPEGADLKFGAVTVLTGVVGTILGGVALDRVGSSLKNATGICSLSTALG